MVWKRKRGYITPWMRSSMDPDYYRRKVERAANRASKNEVIAKKIFTYKDYETAFVSPKVSETETTKNKIKIIDIPFIVTFF